MGAPAFHKSLDCTRWGNQNPSAAAHDFFLKACDTLKAQKNGGTDVNNIAYVTQYKEGSNTWTMKGADYNKQYSNCRLAVDTIINQCMGNYQWFHGGRFGTGPDMFEISKN